MSAFNAQQVLQDAIAHHQAGRLGDAQVLYRQVLDRHPQHADALHLLGLLAFHQGRNDDAIALMSQALAVAPNHAACHGNLGNALLAQGRVQEAIASLERALTIYPGFAEAHNNLGNALKSAGRADEAMRCYQRALSYRPDLAEANYNLGLMLADAGLADEAIARHERALAIRPDHAEGHNSLGNVFRSLGRLDEAAASYRRALALRPDYADAHSNLGWTLASRGLIDEAIRCYDRALALCPDLAEAHWNKAIALLLKGDYAAGWRLYEWRWQAIAKRGALLPQFSQPLWLGDTPLAGRTILLHHEQGLGDTLLVLRYVPLLARQGARVILQMPPSLAELAACVSGVSEVVLEGDALPAFDVQCPMMSLPLAFHTTLDTVPGEVPYLFAPDSAHAVWAQRLGPATRPRIGLVWSGSVSQAHDQRPVPLSRLLPLLDLDADFHSLHKEYRPEEASLMRSDGRIRDWSGQLHDLGETAALVAQLDLVVTIDTAVAHLAGGMGKPTWVMLPFAPDFRWLQGRIDSPWYPTLRLFRQQSIGDWMPVLDAVARELAAHFTKR